MLTNGAQNFSYPATVPDDDFALTGNWSVTDESLTAQGNAGIELNFQADDVYLDVGGTGTVTATVDGKTTAYPVSGPPDIYTLFDKKAEERSLLKISLSPGLSVYSFTFG
jgi:Thioredoxin like C-terminal domain